MPRISTRLAKIEQSTGATSSSDANSMLVAIVGRRDAMFWPWRSHSQEMAEVYRRQKAYLAGSTGISAKADGRENWKSAHFTRQHLIDSNMVTACYSSGQVTSLFITPAGDATAKSLVGERLSSAVSPKMMLKLLRSKPSKEFCEQHWISESVAAGRELSGNPSDWEAFTGYVLPLLVAGVVVAHSDSQGSVYYSLTGQELPAPVQVDGIEASEQMDSIYIKSYNSERNRLMHVIPTDPSEIRIPIPVGW